MNTKKQVAPDGYEILSSPRGNGKTGGGIALVCHSNLSVEIKQNDDFHPRTMETTWYKVKCGNTFLKIHVIYRPLNGSVIDFCEEMTTLLETTILDVNEPIF